MTTTDVRRVRELLEPADPFAGAGPAPEVTERHRRLVMAGLHPHPEPRPRPRLQGLRAAVIGAVAVTAVVAAVAVLPLADPAGTGVPPLVYRAEGVGTEELVVAAQQAASVTVSGPVTYWRTEGWFLHGGESPSEIVPELREHWLSEDAYAFRAGSGPPIPVGELGDERLLGEADGELTTSALPDLETARALPTEPAGVLEALRGGVPGDPTVGADTEAFILAGDLLATHAVPPESQRALLLALPELAGVEVLGLTTDRAGRDVLAVGLRSDYSGAQTSYVLLIAPDTGQLRGREATLLEDLPAMEVTAPEVISYELHSDPAGVAEIGARP